MFIKFSKEKCPLCGNFGREKDRGIFHCTKCNIIYNEYGFFEIDFNEEKPNLWN